MKQLANAVFGQIQQTQAKNGNCLPGMAGEMWFNWSKWGLAVEIKQCDTKIWGWYLLKMISENSVAWQEVVDKWIFIYPLLPLKIYYNTWEQNVTFFSKISMNADYEIILPAYISCGKSRQLCSWASWTNGWSKGVQSFTASELRGKRRWAQRCYHKDLLCSQLPSWTVLHIVAFSKVGISQQCHFLL